MKTKDLVAASVVLAVLLTLLIVPGVGVITYTYGGTYYHEAYPLVQGAVWIQTAQGSAAQAPAYAHPAQLVSIVETQAAQGWTLLNQSDNATGVGMGSPCWFFAVPTQTYAYPNLMLRESFSYLGNLSGSSAFLNNSQFQAAFSVVFNLLGNTYNSMVVTEGYPSLEGCIFFGSNSWFGWVAADLVLAAGVLMIGAWYVPKKKRGVVSKLVKAECEKAKQMGMFKSADTISFFVKGEKVTLRFDGKWGFDNRTKSYQDMNFPYNVESGNE